MMSVHIADGDERLRGAALVGFGGQHTDAAMFAADIPREDIAARRQRRTVHRYLFLQSRLEGVQHDYAAVKNHDAIAEEITVTYNKRRGWNE